MKRRIIGEYYLIKSFFRDSITLGVEFTDIYNVNNFNLITNYSAYKEFYFDEPPTLYRNLINLI